MFENSVVTSLKEEEKEVILFIPLITNTLPFYDLLGQEAFSNPIFYEP